MSCFRARDDESKCSPFGSVTKSADAPSELTPLPVDNPSYNGRIRRDGVSSESIRDQEDIPIVIIPKTDDEKERIRQIIADNILFNHLDADALLNVINAMGKRVYEPDSFIIKQGDPGEEFFVIDDGECECWIKPRKERGKPQLEPVMVQTMSSGNSFGELALMYNSPRSATIKAKTRVQVWTLSRPMFRKLLLGGIKAEPYYPANVKYLGDNHQH